MKTCFFTLFFLIITTILHAQITQPTQPSSGYGGKTYPHGGVTIRAYDNNTTTGGFYLYTPATPQPVSAPVVIFNHGYSAYNPAVYGKWIEHLVKRGNIVIFPRYQIEVATLASQFTPNTVKSIKRAFDTLAANPTFTQPIQGQVAILGHSYGGVVSANLAHNWSSYGIPKPKALLMACAGGIDLGKLSSYAQMDASVHILAIAEFEDNLVDSTFSIDIFTKTPLVPTMRKNYIMHYTDATGSPAINATHSEPCAPDLTYTNNATNAIIAPSLLSRIDATDYYLYWKLSDALLDCAFNNRGCSTAFGNTAEQRSMGKWSNSTSVKELRVLPTSTTAISDINFKSTVFPNPVNNQLHLNTEGGIRSVEIMDMTGRIVLKQVFQNRAKQQTIDLQSQNSGIYCLKMDTDMGIAVHKIIKK